MSETIKAKFEEAVYNAAKSIKRLKVLRINNYVVHCKVDTVSGISSWEFSLNFNDYGRLTGNFDVSSTDNYDSSIPESFGNKIKNIVTDFIGDNLEPIKVEFLLVKCKLQLVPTGEDCKVYTLSKEEIENATWEQIETALKTVLPNRNIVRKNGYLDAERHNPINDDYVALAANGEQYPCVEYGSYEGFSYQDTHGDYLLMDQDAFERAPDEYIIKIFKDFFESLKAPDDNYWSY